jgi:4-aminobutyrate aminotransferase-like enzyme
VDIDARGGIGGSRFLPLTRPFIRVPNAHCYRCPLGLERKDCGGMCAKMLRLTLERGIAGNAAGVIIEPIQASAGQIILPKEYLEEVRKICDEFSVPLVYDEIQTYCRIGEFFAGQYFGVHPDIIVLGKGLGAGLPIAAIIISDKLEGFSPDAEELHTFANTSVGQVSAAKQIELMEKGVLENCRKMGAYLKEHLLKLQKEYPEMGDIRQAGLHIGVEFVKDPESKEPLTEQTVDIRKEGFKNGIIFGLGGVCKNVLKIKPPLIIKTEECDELADRLEKSMSAVLRK